MRIITSVLFTLFLSICVSSLNAQIISESFNASPWESAKGATSITEVTTDAGVWKVFNTEINIEQASSNPGSIGALIFPKNLPTPNLETRPFVEIPTIASGGVNTVELIARYGARVNVYSQLEVQKLVDGEWMKIGETLINESNSNKPTKYIIHVDDLSDNVKLRLYYNGDNLSSAIRVSDLMVFAPALGVASNLEAINITENSFDIQWEHAMLADSYEVVIAKRNAIENVELTTNGDAELADDATWTLLNAEINSDKVYQGNHAFCLTSTTAYAGMLQKVSVEPGTTISITAKGFVAENTTGTGSPVEYTSEMRLWGQFLNNQSENVGSVRIAGLPELKEPSTEWFDLKLENLLVPENATILDLDFRAQVGVKAYFDNISVIGSKVVRESISETPLTTNLNSYSISNLMPNQEYSVYVYSVKGEEKAKSAELIVKTEKGTGINESSQNKTIVYLENGMLYLSNVTFGETVYIVNSVGQTIYHSIVNESLFKKELPKGFYLIKVGDAVYKVSNAQ